MLESRQRIYGLDLIRALAIILVIVSHCTYILPEFNLQLTRAIRLLGATGVDIFFVLSGYLIGGLLIRNLETGKTRFKDLFYFWKRRWLRTLPNYFVVLILNILILIFLGADLVENLWLYIPFFQNFTNAHPDFFTEAWSLSIEEYAYIILPLIIYVILNLRKYKDPVKCFFYTTLVVIIVLFILKIKFYNTTYLSSYSEWSSMFRKVVIYRLDTIYIGFILVYFNKTFSQFLRKNKTALLLLGVFIFVGLHLLIIINNYQPETHLLFYSYIYLIAISISIALVFPFVIYLKSQERIRPLIQYISIRSYAIYLINYSLVLLTLKRFFNSSLMTLFLYIMLTIVLSELLFRYVELAFLKYRDRKFPK
ncbi:acyltransferase family protein [Winogradskyella immobilis]|uniref:Acyltransferase n=1 Tax=Winogradskyella immobilis TaxID=2816852 RepID=A0ABS8EP90_9FLAO|nr:acyltransferase [Winogradskyella immobilis]MCC1485034.1 acyltransferase [Winogradskyella immobilis]MCG0017126.1 acyltransferase [Winogradskyella immobilis]